MSAGESLEANPARVRPVLDERARLGGRIRVRTEDFQVEEIPLFRAAGRGDHVLFEVEKVGISTFDLLLALSKTAKVSESAIGYAGLKDAQAVTRQFLSVHRVSPERLLSIRHTRFRVLGAQRHDRPLKIGHLRGNRFTIRIREADTSRLDAARRTLEVLVRRGLPNAYGAQRFGTRLESHRLGRALVDEDWQAFFALLLGAPSAREYDPRIREARAAYDAGDIDRAFATFPLRHRTEKKALGALRRGEAPRRVFQALGRGARRMWVSAWQSYLFNCVLDERIRQGTYDRVLAGDLAWLTDSSACYPVVDADAEAARAARIEASATGPLVGFDPAWASGEPGRIERDVLRSAGADPEAFRAQHVRARAHRRPLRVPLREASLEREDGRTVLARFVLPPGAFATVLLAHLMGEAAATALPQGSVRGDG